MSAYNVDNMTQFELKIMREYIDINDILFDRVKDDADAIYDACERVIKNRANTDPNIIQNVRNSYIAQLSELIEELRNDSASSRKVIDEIVKCLNRYYAIVFSKINMVNAQNGQISSYDICSNYNNCSLALEELENVLQQKQDLRNRKF